MPALRSPYLCTPRGGSVQWSDGPAGAVLRSEVFGPPDDGDRLASASGAIRFGGIAVSVPASVKLLTEFTGTPGASVAATPPLVGAWNVGDAYAAGASSFVFDASGTRAVNASSGTISHLQWAQTAGANFTTTITFRVVSGSSALLTYYPVETTDGNFNPQNASKYAIRLIRSGADVFAEFYDNVAESAVSNVIGAVETTLTLTVLGDATAQTLRVYAGTTLLRTFTSAGLSATATKHVVSSDTSTAGVELDALKTTDTLDVPSAGLPALSASASGAIVRTGTATATVRASGVASGAIVRRGSSAGGVRVSGAAGGAIRLTGTATATRRASASASGALRLGGSASSAARVAGAASGALRLTGAATATAASPRTASAAGTIVLRGAVSGTAPVSGSAAGALVFVGTATAESTARTASATGVVVYRGTASAAAIRARSLSAHVGHIAQFAARVGETDVVSSDVSHECILTARVHDTDAFTAFVTHHARYSATITDRPL